MMMFRMLRLALGRPAAAGSGNSGNSEEDTAGSDLDPGILGVSTPEVPGDISICGTMPADAVFHLAARYKSWLYLNPPDQDFHKEELKAAGCEYEVVILPSPASGSNPTSETADAILAAIGRLPRPLMLQCTSGNRAGAALLLWLAREQGHNSASASLLAQDLDLAFFTRCSGCGPVRDWVLSQLQPSNEDASKSQAQVKAASEAGYVIHQLLDTQGSFTFTYLVGCKSSREALLIDPVLGMQERDLTLAGELGFKIKYVVNTHCHADHVTAGSAIKKLLPEVRTIISQASGAAADMKLQDGDRIEIGQYALEAMATPGHTDGCMTFVLQGPGEPQAAFTGDSLLIRGCGRTDFQAGNAGQLFDSVHQRIFTLPGSTKIYPGHDYKGRNVSTVEEERQFNPRLSKDKETFEKIMNELNLPLPKFMDIAVPANMVDGIAS